LKSPIAKKTKNFREAEDLNIRLNIYDLVWDKSRKGGNNNAGFVDLGLGFYHTGKFVVWDTHSPNWFWISLLLPGTVAPIPFLYFRYSTDQSMVAGLELWGKELSFGHSKRFKSGLFAVKPRKADEMMPHTVFRESIEMGTISISRYR
jgi:hypothetical protein